jgi:hypothetical protein
VYRDIWKTTPLNQIAINGDLSTPIELVETNGCFAFGKSPRWDHVFRNDPLVEVTFFDSQGRSRPVETAQMRIAHFYKMTANSQGVKSGHWKSRQLNNSGKSALF